MSLEKQVAQVANSLNLRPQGGLPGDTEPNPKQLNAVNNRSGLQIEKLSPNKRDIKAGTKENKMDEGIPKYAKYVKEIVANKRRLTEYETVALTEECISRIQNTLPTKLKDLDYEPDSQVPFILGRPFLATGRTLIDAAAGQLTMRAHDKVEVFDVYRALKFPSIYEELSVITVVDHIVESQLIVPEDLLERVLVDTALRIRKRTRKAIGWQMDDIHGISSALCMQRIYMEDDHKPNAQHQLTLNHVMKEVVRKEVIKWLDAGIVYPIADSKSVSPVQCVPKKGGITVVRNEKNELIPTRTMTGWRICMDYRKLNDATCKDHYPVPFIDQMLDRLAGQEYYYFLDRYSIYTQILISPEDQEKTTFTCIYGTYAFKRMPFGLCNVPATFQRCFYRRFIMDFTKIARPLCSFLEKEVKFDFDEMFLKAFQMLKRNLIEAPILIAPDWELPFKLMYDASDVAVGAVLGQRKGKVFYSIYYASKTLDSTQANYTVTEKEIRALVFAFDKFRSYLVKVIVFTDHADIRIRFDCCQSHLLIAFYNLAKWESYLKDALPHDINPFVFAKEYNIHPDILSTSNAPFNYKGFNLICAVFALEMNTVKWDEHKTCFVFQE
ncbi:uncharacterized protein [Solanum tuberosum]|uniref:uncharacterized protein n=1 Tax=Solanum tuberosum TaxID=4113 RepID=UPI00073A4399|nr:PREDICTED: uncharacterized protein LOC107062119 [Solanum tuberosum]